MQTLEKDFQGKIIVPVSEILDHCERKELYPNARAGQILTHIRELDECTLILLVGTGEDPNKQWIILNIISIAVSLHTEIIQFAGRCSIPQHVGMISEQKLVSIFPDTTTAPLIQCLRHLLFCREVKSHASVFHALGIDTRQQPQASQPTADVGIDKSYFLFPSLIQASRTDRSWKSPKYQPFNKGFYVRTLKQHLSFPTQFASIVLLELASKMVFLVPCAKRGSFELWKHGIQWVAISGVEVVVEFVREGRGVVVMVRGSEVGCDRVLSAVMTKLSEARVKFCHTLPTEVCSIHPDSFTQEGIPEFGQLHLFNMEGVQSALHLLGLVDEEEKLLVPYSKLAGLTFWSK